MRANPACRGGQTGRHTHSHALADWITAYVRTVFNLTEVTGTGHDGIIRRADVEAVLAERAVPLPRDGRTDRRIPLRGLRKTVADKLSTSRREIPEATVWVDVDATELVAARAVLNERDPARPVSLLSLVARFTRRRAPPLPGAELTDRR